MIEPVLARIDADLNHAISRLFEFLRIPSVSTDPAYKKGCDRAADWLVNDLRSLGFHAEKLPTPGHPMVVANCGTSGDEGMPHLLFYGHYDVQPVDPLELWDRDPFDPELQDTPTGQVIRGRGSSDDKGQLMTFLEACRAWKSVHGTLPVRLTLFFEGEEESGSPSLIPFLRDHADALTADLALICDTGLFADRVPIIVTRLRGLISEELTIKGPSKDLHSGMYGGPAMNPARVLARVLASLHDADGRVTVPGFYDGVENLPADIARQWQELDFDHSAFLGGVGLAEPAGEAARAPLEQLWSRPTCEINGLWSGYTGDGFKTVLPAQASAKVSFRLVGHQDPETIRANFHALVRAMLPPDCEVEFTSHANSAAAEMETDHPGFEQARKALAEEWGVEAAFGGCGGSIPVAGYFKSILGMNTMLIGFARDNDQVHSPNEKYDLECFQKGIRSWVRILAAMAP